MADQLGVVLFGDLDINKTVKNINSQIGQIENKLKTVNFSLDINIKSAFKDIENVTSKIYKSAKDSINEELRLAEQIAKLREKTESKTQKVDRQNELKQANAINKALEDQYKLEKDIALWKEKQEININKLSSKGNIDTSKLNRLKDSLNKISAESMDARNEMKSFQNELARVNVEADKSSDSILKTAMSYFTLYDAFQLIKQTAKSMVGSINDMNKSLTDIRVVTGMSSKEANELAESYNELGKALGATTNEMLQGSVEWFRQGKTIAETQELITASMVGAKLSGIESAQMTEYLTSALNGYKMQASSAINVVDKLVAVDNAAATSVEELAIAMSRTANSAQMAGVSMDDLIGYIGTVSSVTRRSAETVGESFKTILSRFQNLRLGKFTEDGEVMSDVRKALANVNIEIMESETKFKDFGSVLDELNSKWDALTDTEKSSIATAMAGVRQRETFLVLMENMNMSAELTKTSLDSAGLAMERFGIWSESTEAALNRFKNTAEELFMNTMNSDTINNIINISANIISTVDKVGLLNVAFITLAGTMAMVGKAKNIAWLTSLPSMLGAATNGVTALTSALLTNPLFLGAVGLVGAIKLIDALTVTLDEQKQKVEKLKNGYDELVSKIETLKSIENPTEGNERQIALLERELALQEKLLAIETERLTKKQFEAAYGGIQSDLDALQTSLKLYEDTQNRILQSGGDASQFATLASKEQDLVKYAQKTNETLTSLMGVYDDLDDAQKEQADGMIKQAEAALKLADDILGLNANTKKQTEANNELANSIDRLSVQALTQEVSSLSEAYDDNVKKIELLNKAINSLNDNQTLTSDTILSLLNTFPSLRGEITETNGVYSISKEALLELKNQAVDTFSVMVNDQRTATNEAIANAKTRISAYQKELEQLKKLAQGQMSLYALQNQNKTSMGYSDIIGYSKNSKTSKKIIENNESIKQKEKQIQQEQAEMQKYLDLLNQIEIKEQDFEIATSSANTKKGSNISNKKSKKDKKDSQSQYIKSLYQSLVDDVLKGGQDVEKAIEMTNLKIENATLLGDEKLVSEQSNYLTDLFKQERDKQAEMAKQLDKYISDMKQDLSKTGLFNNIDLSSLSNLQLDIVINNIDKQLASANDKEKQRLEGLKSVISDVGSVYIDTIQKREELSKIWWEKENQRRQQQINNIHEIADLEKRAYDDKIKRIRLEQMLMDDSSSEYQAKEEEKYQLLLGLKLRYEDKIRQLKAQGLSQESEDVRKYVDLWVDAEEELLNMRKSMAERQREIGLKGYEERLKVLNDQKAAIKTITDLTIQMIKKEIEVKKKAFQEEINGYQAIINKKKEALRKEEEDRDYKKELSEIEKEEKILNDKLAELSLDNSGDMNEKRLELEEKLRELLEKKEELQNDKSLQNKEDLLDQELEAFEKEKQDEIDKLDDYLDKEGQLRQDALDMIKRNNKEMHEKLLEYNATYGDAMQEDIVKAWGLATDAANEFNNGQMDLLDILKDVTDEMAEQVRLQDELKNAHWSNIEIETGNNQNINTGTSSNNSNNKPSNSGLSEKGKEQLNMQKYLHEQMEIAIKTNNEGLKKWVREQRRLYDLDPNSGAIIKQRHSGLELGRLGDDLKPNELILKATKDEWVFTNNQMRNITANMNGLINAKSTQPELKIDGGLVNLIINGNPDKDIVKLLKKETDRIANYTIDKIKESIYSMKH